MVLNRGDKSGTTRETFSQMAKSSGLRNRILLTLFMLILVRIGIYLPVPSIDRVRFNSAVQSSGIGGIVGFLDIFSGGGLSLLGIFALGILPFINASIIMQLLTAALPSLEDLQKNEGEAGRRKISQITRYVALGWSVVQSLGIALWVQGLGASLGSDVTFVLQSTLALTAGSMFVMWVGELITEYGIGNGASLLIFINIVSTFPRSIGQTLEIAQDGSRERIGGIIILILAFLSTIVGIVFVQEGIRRIPIVSARRQVGRKIYAERSSYLPLRLNQGGVMPIIFATAVLVLPASIAEFTGNQWISSISTYLNPTGSTPWVYVVFYLLLILFFSYFYASIVVNPVDMAQELKKRGSSIPGVRPGKATSKRIGQILDRLTFLGAIFLGLVAIVPTAVESATNIRTFQGLGATSFLIIVGVAIDTSKQVQTYVISQRYEGMVRE